MIRHLGRSDALGLVELASPWWCAYASSSARGERERDKRSVDRLIQNNLDGCEGTAMLGTKRGRSRRLPTPPAPGEVVSLHPDNNPTPQNPKEFSRWRSGAWEIASETRKTLCCTPPSSSVVDPNFLGKFFWIFFGLNWRELYLRQIESFALGHRTSVFSVHPTDPPLFVWSLAGEVGRAVLNRTEGWVLYLAGFLAIYNGRRQLYFCDSFVVKGPCSSKS